MANLFFQGKLIRQFCGKINRQSNTSTHLQYVTWGGGLKLPEW